MPYILFRQCEWECTSSQCITIIKQDVLLYKTKWETSNTENRQVDEIGMLTENKASKSFFTRVSTCEIVGREEEMKVFRFLLSTVQEQSQIDAAARHRVPCGVLLTGAPGIGKTQLAHAMGKEAERQGWSVLLSRCYEQEKKLAYHLCSDILQQAFFQDIWQPQEMSIQHHLSPSLITLFPQITDLLTQALSLSPPVSEYISLRLWESIQTIITTISTATPLLIIIDDMQWIDEESCNVLGYLLRHIHGFPIVVLGTSCPNEQRESRAFSSLAVDLQKERLLETRTLAPLAPEHIRAVVASAHFSQLSEREIEQIQEKACGNPFLAEVLAYSSPFSFPLPIVSFFENIFRHVSEACWNFLLNVAVLGPSFTFSIARDVCLRGLKMDEERCIDILEEAQRSGILIEEGNGSAIAYSFQYPLLVEYLSSAVSIARWTRLQRRVGTFVH